MRILDLYCGAGGASYGFNLTQQQHDIIGIDSKPQPRYPFTFIQRNALSVDTKFIREFDFVFASPPCQCYVSSAHRDQHPDLVAATIHMLHKADIPWCVENVPSAPFQTRFITLCGTMFPPLRVVRHRRFAYHPDLIINQPEHIPRDEHPRVYSFDRRKARNTYNLNEWDNFVTVAGNNASLGAMSDAMGIHWMTRPEIAQAVPPKYSRYILSQVILNINRSRPAVPL